MNDDLSTPWKIHLPSTLAGTVEMYLLDPVHGKPRYAARRKLLVRLLEVWVAKIEGKEPIPLPSLEEIRNA